MKIVLELAKNTNNPEDFDYKEVEVEINSSLITGITRLKNGTLEIETDEKIYIPEDYIKWSHEDFTIIGVNDFSSASFYNWVSFFVQNKIEHFFIDGYFADTSYINFVGELPYILR